MAVTALAQAARFGAVGLLNTGLGLAAIYGCMFFLRLGPEISNLLGYVAGLSFGFWLNRRWTFADSAKISRSAPRYVLVIAVAYLINLGIVATATRSGVNPYLAQICGLAPYTLISFLGCRFYVFAQSAAVPTPGTLTRLLWGMACIAGASLFTFLYVSAEQPVYHGDFLIYNTVYKNLAHSFSEGWLEGLLDLRIGVGNDDYNPSAVLLLTPIHQLLGGDRVYYVMGVVLLYLAPATVIAARLAKLDFRSPAFLAAFLFPLFWMPTLRGMVDIAGLIPLGLAVLLLFKTDYLAKARTTQAIGFGLLLWCAFLFRRWYIFSLIALVGVAFLFAVARDLRQRGSLIQAIRDIMPNYAIAGVAAVIGLLSFQAPLAARIVQSSYKDLYAAFQRDLATHLQIYFDHCGFLTLALILVGLIHAARRRREDILFSASVAIITALLFDQVHPPDRHHLLPLALFLFPAYFTGLCVAMRGLMPARLAPAAMALLAGLNFLSTFTPFNWGLAEPLRMIFARERYAPLRLEHFSEYQRLTDDLRQLGPVTIGVFAAETKPLAYDMLFTIEPALERRILPLANIDMRDGFNWRALGIDYAVVATPIPLGQRPGTQRNIEYPAQDILGGTGIGAAFAKTGATYHLDDGVTAYVYKRMRPITSDEIGDLANRFYEAYPDWRKERLDIGFGLATADVDLGDQRGRVIQIARKTIAIRPGESAPTTIRFHPNEWFQPRSFTAYAVNDKLRRCDDGEALRLDVAFGTDAPASYAISGDGAAKIATTPSAPFAITAFPKASTKCAAVAVEFDLGEPQIP